MFGKRKRQEVKLAREFAEIMADMYTSKLMLHAKVYGVPDDDNEINLLMLRHWLTTIGVSEDDSRRDSGKKNVIALLRGRCSSGLPIGLFHAAFYLFNEINALEHPKDVQRSILETLREHIDEEDVQGFRFSANDFDQCIEALVSGN